MLDAPDGVATPVPEDGGQTPSACLGGEVSVSFFDDLDEGAVTHVTIESGWGAVRQRYASDAEDALSSCSSDATNGGWQFCGDYAATYTPSSRTALLRSCTLPTTIRMQYDGSCCVRKEEQQIP